MKNVLILFFCVCRILTISAQSSSCLTATPFCTSSSVTYPASQNATAQTGPDYSCLGTQPNPAWFTFKIASPGSITLNMSNSASVDIDYIIWGPFTSLVNVCNDLTTNIVDCSYSASSNETATIPLGKSESTIC